MHQTIYHLSHIDLDGYGCQFLTTKHFTDITCFNANYGPEVIAKLEEIIKSIERNKFLHSKADEHLILVTDLNLTTKEANWLEREAMRVGAKIELLDHHITGKSASENFAWYHLDSSRCATALTYHWLKKYYDFDPTNRHSDIVKTINAIDIWVADDEFFEYGKVCLGMISGAKEINRTLFDTQDRSYKLALIAKAEEFVGIEGGNILLDDALHGTKKAFFFQGHNDTKDNLVASYITMLLTKEKAKLTITYRGYKGLLGYNVGSSSLIGNAFLIANPEFDFYMDVNYRGNFSLRGHDRVDLSLMASEIGGGGGHYNASGGKIDGYKDSFVYSQVKGSIQEIIDEITGA